MPAVLLVAIAAAAAGWFLGGIVNIILSNKVGYVTAFATSTAIGLYYFTELLTVAIVALAPLWVVLVASIALFLLCIPLRKRGYLGKRAQWKVQLEQDDRYTAAMLLLNDEQIDEVASLSSDADDFHDNIIEAAGLTGHEAPGLD